MNGLMQDVRFGVRALLRNYRTTVVAVLSLAFGIGAVTSIYCTVSAVLLNPVPFPERENIVQLADTVEGREDSFTSAGYLDFMEYQKTLGDQFEQIAAFSGIDVSFTGPGGPERLLGAGVSASFFPLLRTKFLLGRTLDPKCDEVGSAREVVIGENIWRRAFGASPEAIGKSILLDGESYTVCGVVPETFRFVMTGAADFWVPLTFYGNALKNRGNHWLLVWGRLREGGGMQQAEQAYSAVVQRLGQEFPATNAGRFGRLIPPGELMLQDFRPAFLMLMGAVVFVLLIACVNVASLLLANAAGRRKEIAVRAALGATRGRIIRQLLTESVLLAALGGALGMLVALWGNSLIFMLVPAENREFHVKYFEMGLRPGVFAFAAGVSMLTGLIFGLAPALEATKLELADTLKEGGRGGGGGMRRHRLLASLVVVEVALALVLLVGAGLFIQSMRVMYTTDPGFDTKNLLTFQVPMSSARASDRAESRRFFERVEARLGQLGGVTALGGAQITPFTNSNSNTWVILEGKPEPPPGKTLIANFRIVTPTYMNALGVPVLAGRGLEASDRVGDDILAFESRKDAPAIETPVLINETMAKQYWPGEDAVGKRFAQASRLVDVKDWNRVVGVVRDFHEDTLGEPIEPTMFVPFGYIPDSEMFFALRADVPVEGLVPDIRKALQEIDPNLPISYVATMEKNIEEVGWFRTFISGILIGFALIALLLSAVGVYGVINCSVTQRTHEIGVRMALGANPGDVQRMIVGKGLKLAVAGMLIGNACALGLTRFMQDLLYGVSPLDPLTFISVTLILILVAGGASWIPARKATKVNPVVALRYE